MRDLVISTTSFNEFHHKLYILKISGTIVEQLEMRKKVTTSVISQ